MHTYITGVDQPCRLGVDVGGSCAVIDAGTRPNGVPVVDPILATPVLALLKDGQSGAASMRSLS